MVERRTSGLLVGPESTLTGALDLGRQVGVRDQVGLRQGLGLGLGWGLRFGLLLLLQEDLVVQKLELSRVPVDEDNKLTKNNTIHGQKKGGGRGG